MDDNKKEIMKEDKESDKDIINNNIKEIKSEDNKNDNENNYSEQNINEIKYFKDKDKINRNISEIMLEKENEKLKRREMEKLKKKERKNKLLAKKLKSSEEIENEKIFLENNKILINFLGDSITQGLKWQKKEIFCYYLSKWLNIKVNNQGVHSTRIARQDGDDKDFNYRLKDLDDKADFTFIFGGTNDYGMGEAELGDINSDSYYTFYGALKNLVKNLLKKFNNDKICFILPLSRFEENKIIKHGTLSNYREIIKEICDLNKIDYLDLCEQLPIPNIGGKSEYFKDGLHPNKKGHKLIAKNIIKYLKNKGIINNNFIYKE